MSLFARWTETLDGLKAQGRFRALKPPRGIDFTSNDYLGYGSRSEFRVPSSELGKGPQPGTRNPEPGTSSRNPESGTSSALARIEIGPAELAKMLAGDRAAQVNAALKKLGYAHVTLDLQGYRRAGGNETTLPPTAG